MIKLVFNYCMIFSVLTGISFVSSFLLSKKGKDKTIIYLSLVVSFFTLNNLQIALIDNVFTNANFFIRNLLIPFYVLILPSFYAFLIYYLKVENKIKSYIVATIIIFGIEIVIRFLFFNLYYNDDKSYIIAKYAQIEEIINALFSLFLFAKSFILLFNCSKMYQYVLSFDSIKWLKTFMYLGSIIVLTWIFAIILNLDKVVNPQIFIYYPLRLSSSVLLFWIGYQGFFNYSLMTERIELRKFIENNEIVNSNYITEIPQIKIDKFNLIEEYIEKNKSYLDATLSLEKLALELKMSKSSLSECIKSNKNTNFSDFINKKRIEKAKKYLTNLEYSQYTILSIGLECGFNSKSVFYSAFKKFTNLTPIEYKRQNS